MDKVVNICFIMALIGFGIFLVSASIGLILLGISETVMKY